MISTQCKDSFIFFLCFHLVTSSFLLLSYYCFIYNFYLNKRHILLPQEGGTYYHTMLKSSGELGRVLLSLFFFSFFFLTITFHFSTVSPARETLLFVQQTAAAGTTYKKRNGYMLIQWLGHRLLMFLLIILPCQGTSYSKC